MGPAPACAIVSGLDRSPARAGAASHLCFVVPATSSRAAASCLSARQRRQSARPAHSALLALALWLHVMASFTVGMLCGKNLIGSKQ